MLSPDSFVSALKPYVRASASLLSLRMKTSAHLFVTKHLIVFTYQSKSLLKIHNFFRIISKNY